MSHHERKAPRSTIGAGADMRRFLLMLTLITVSAWAQPAQQQAPPIVVQVEMPPTPHRDFLGYLQALGPLTAALTALGVGFMQWHLQKQHLKQNLYDKRWKVYTAVHDYLMTVYMTDGRQDTPYDQFRRDTAPGEFLFKPKVWDYIKEAGETGVAFRSAQRMIERYQEILDPHRVISNLEDKPQYDEALAKMPGLIQKVNDMSTKVANAVLGDGLRSEEHT